MVKVSDLKKIFRTLDSYLRLIRRPTYTANANMESDPTIQFHQDFLKLLQTSRVLSLLASASIDGCFRF